MLPATTSSFTTMVTRLAGTSSSAPPRTNPRGVLVMRSKTARRTLFPGRSSERDAGRDASSRSLALSREPRSTTLGRTGWIRAGPAAGKSIESLNSEWPTGASPGWAGTADPHSNKPPISNVDATCLATPLLQLQARSKADRAFGFTCVTRRLISQLRSQPVFQPASNSATEPCPTKHESEVGASVQRPVSLKASGIIGGRRLDALTTKVGDGCGLQTRRIQPRQTGRRVRVTGLTGRQPPEGRAPPPRHPPVLRRRPAM